MNPMVDDNSSALLVIPIHNITQPISYYDVWEGNAMVIVAFGGSYGDISNIVDRSTQQQ